MGAEDALGLGIEVVGTVAQVVGETEDGTMMSDENVATRAVNRDALATQVTQCGEIIHLANGESIDGSHC